MVLKAATDILFMEEPRPDALRELAARAFGVETRMVAVGPLRQLSPPPGSRVVLQRQPEDLPGDFPVWYGLAVDDSLLQRVTPALDAVAHGLGIVAISDAADDEAMTLHLLDGSDHVVRLEQDEDDAFRITPEIRHLIESATVANARHPVRL